MVSFKEQRATFDSPLLSIPLLSLLFCSLPAVEPQVKKLTSKGHILTHWVSFTDAQRPSILLYLTLPRLHTQSLFSALSAPSDAFSYHPFGSLVSQSPCSFFHSLPLCPALSILAGVIDFCKG